MDLYIASRIFAPGTQAISITPNNRKQTFYLLYVLELGKRNIGPLELCIFLKVVHLFVKFETASLFRDDTHGSMCNLPIMVAQIKTHHPVVMIY